MRKCPSCNSNYVKRVPRSFTFKLIPKSKIYKCYYCKTKFLKVPYLALIFILKKGLNTLTEDRSKDFNFLQTNE